MDIGILITAGIGIVTTFCSGFFTFLFSKKKYNAEVDSTTIKNLQNSVELYENIIDDLKERLDFYIELSESNRSEMYRVKNIMFQLLDNVCTNSICKERKLYSEDEIAKILGVENGKIPISYDTHSKKDRTY